MVKVEVLAKDQDVGGAKKVAVIRDSTETN